LENKQEGKAGLGDLLGLQERVELIQSNFEAKVKSLENMMDSYERFAYKISNIHQLKEFAERKNPKRGSPLDSVNRIKPFVPPSAAKSKLSHSRLMSEVARLEAEKDKMSKKG
jgi:hypothetical protein